MYRNQDNLPPATRHPDGLDCHGDLARLSRRVFKNGRQFAAWLGLTPRQYSGGSGVDRAASVQASTT
ncbi:MAG: IS110 family transposase [Gammaproteobacteria bacterium]|nr:MAG: IS110 family transposase [Gammaproteobacteria bacterium]TLY99120.1 MAG: IS110 family transposase [Gammaproteobacteria bacterium]TLZ36652.1 MAG: IS110 family transposase [Gammaproteobacteria bacterium]